MKKLKFSVFVFFFSLVCSAFTGDILELKKIQKIDSEETDEIYKCMDLTIDEQNNIYIIDGLDNLIKKFDKNGKLLKKAGRKGAGPREFKTLPGLVYYYKNKLYVTQQIMPNIQVFDKNLTFKYVISTGISPWCIDSFENKLFAGNSYFRGKLGIVQFDKQGIKKDNIDFKRNIKDLIYKGKKFVIDKMGNFYIVYNYINKIAKYNKEKKLIWSKSLKFLDVYKSKKNKIGYPEKTTFKDIKHDIKHDKEELFYILGGGYSKNVARDIYILNSEGKHLKTLTLDEPSHFIHIDENNKLYSRGDMGCAINVYKIIKKGSSKDGKK